MTSSITSLIISYTNDYVAPSNENNVLIVTNLLTRFIFKVGALTVKSGKETIVLPISKTIVDKMSYIYQAWLDNENSIELMGTIELEVFKKLKNGRLFSINTGNEVVHEKAYHNIYASDSSGIVLVHELSSFGKGKFHGIGTGLMQMAAEVSQINGFGIKLILVAAWNSPGFYRKLKLTTTVEESDQEIDAELAKAKMENRPPKTDDYRGFMCVKEEGQAKFTDMISKNPILESHKS